MIKPVIVCISKNQENYIDDFIFYHLDIGFEKIYIYMTTMIFQNIKVLVKL